MAKIAAPLIVLSCSLLAGCGPALSSSDVKSLSSADVAAGRNRGEVYYLPRAVLTARLIASPTKGLRVVIDQPEIIADTGATLAENPAPLTVQTAGCTQTPPSSVGPFILSHRITGFHKDTITIETERSLLKSTVADTEEQTTEALGNLAKSVASFTAESQVEGNDEELKSVRFDPASCVEVARASAIIRDAIDTVGLDKLRELDNATPNPVMTKMLLAPTPSDFAMRVAGFAPFRLPQGARTSSADCRVGVCVPVQVPASIIATMGKRRRETPVLHLPNQSDPVAIPVSRSGFADVKTTLTLDHGILTKREVVRTSEVAAILLLPATLVGAYLDELSSTFKKRKTALDDELAWKKAQEDAKAKAESADEGGGTALLEMPVPGLSIGGSARSTGLVNNPTTPVNNGAPDGKVSPQGDGQAAPVSPQQPAGAKPDGKAL
ncbi:hypothetical protein [Sphingomonas lacusdianchii]|uniref:hypothetical protein n=1 Tax=Sphingomonas lacusdianchii TaxID=2917992 RepID=UPI001F560360|nr:hypothetical protein [Sphingomonas sp. JXJ CY 53]